MPSRMDPGSSQEARDLFKAVKQYLTGGPHPARGLWRLLEDDERAKLGDSYIGALDRYKNPIEMWRVLHPISKNAAIIDLGEELEYLTPRKAEWLRKELGVLPRDPEQAQSVAIHRGDLVIERSSRSVYWDCELIETDWYKHNESWEFLLLSCEKALEDKPVDDTDFSRNIGTDDKHVPSGVVSKKKYRLGKLIPDELHAAFICQGTGTQKFNIPREKIHLFD